jgi:FkbM family methyltransferase
VKNFSYSQAGEDIVLSMIFRRMLDAGKRGFYVDVGAYHPDIDSNTHLFHKSGWRGINIDPTPGSMKAFNTKRPGDINLECGVGSAVSERNFYWLGANSTMNTFERANLEANGMMDKVIRTIPIKTEPLGLILSRYQKEFSEINLLSIDVEGLDLEVLQSNDWSRYRPQVIAVELNVSGLCDALEASSCKFLQARGYSPIAQNFIIPGVCTVIYSRNDLGTLN